LDDITKEEKLRDRRISRQYTLNVKRRVGERADDEETDEEDEGDQDQDDTGNVSMEEQMKTTYLRLCIVNEVLELVELVCLAWLNLLAYHLSLSVFVIHLSRTCPLWTIF